MTKNQSTEDELEDIKSRYDRMAGFLVAAVVVIVLLLAVLSAKNPGLWQSLSTTILSSTFLVILAFVGVFPFSYIAYQIRRKEIKIKRLSHEFRLLGLSKGATEEAEVRQLYDRAYNWGQYVLYISLIILVSTIILLLYAPLSPLSTGAVGSDPANGLPVVLPTAASPDSRDTAASAAPFPPISAATDVTTTVAISPTQPVTVLQSIATSRAITTTQQITLTSALTATVAISPSQSVTLTSTIITAAPLPSQPIIPTNNHVISLVFFAFLGAYIYSVIEVIRRYNTFDLQPQVYASILVRMIAAVVLVFVGALTIFNSPSTYQPPNAAPGYATIWLPAIIAFVIGAFPGRGLDWFRRLADPVLTGRTAATPAALPIENLLGVSTWHASRLEQIGIDDAQNLAGADLRELLLTTQFDAQVIVNWVDQAILYVKVGPDIDKYRKKNIATFTALRRAVPQTIPPVNSAGLDTLAHQLGLADGSELQRLASDPGFSNYHHLESYYTRAPLVIARVAQEAQDAIIGQARYQNFDEAIKYGNDLLELHCEALDASLLRTLGTAYWQRAMSRKQSGEIDKAVADFATAIGHFNKALEQDRTSAEAHYGLSQCFLELTPTTGEERQQWQNAVNSATRAITYDRHFAEAFNIRAIAHEKLGNLDLAKQDLDEALHLNGRLAEAYYRRGMLAANSAWTGADPSQAVADFEKAYLCGYRDEGGIKLGLGKANFDLNQLEEAAQNLTEAIGLLEEGRLPEAYFARTLTFLNQGRRNEAQADAEWIVNRDPNYSSALTRRCYRILVALQDA